jgi:hypothetical protein
VAVVAVQFKVGMPRTEALVRLYDTVNSNADCLPQGLGVLDPIIKPKGIDDVPIVTLTLYGTRAQSGAYDLERVAHSVEADLKRVAGTREVTTIGGPGRTILVSIDPARMAGSGVTVADLRAALLSANLGLPLGELLTGNRAVALESGPFLAQAQDVADLVVGDARGTTGLPARRGQRQRRPAAAEPLHLVRQCRQGRRGAGGVPGGHDQHQQEARRERDRRRRCGDASRAGAAQRRDPGRRARRRDPQRNYGATRQRQGAQPDPVAAVRDRLGGDAGVRRARPPRDRDRRHCRRPDADGDTVRVVGLGLHP